MEKEESEEDSDEEEEEEDEEEEETGPRRLLVLTLLPPDLTGVKRSFLRRLGLVLASFLAVDTGGTSVK